MAHYLTQEERTERVRQLTDRLESGISDVFQSDRYEVIVTTHLDKAHLHNHIVFNSVSFTDGLMYRDQLKDYYGGDGIGIRGTSDAVCREHSLLWQRRWIMETEKGLRLLYLYEALVRGDGIRKKEAAERFGGDEKSIQRDIEVLKNYFAEQTPPMEIQYIPKEHCHRLVSSERSYLTCGEVLAVCKILLESRSLPRKEMDGIIDKLLSACVSPKNEKAIKNTIGNERLHYIEPHHGKALTNRLWKLGEAIESHSVLRVTYHTQTGQMKQRILQPVGLMFLEFYFYLTAFIDEIDREAHFEDADDLFPTIYRVDRIKKLEVLNRHFRVPYSQRFLEGEFRKRVQFMYGGKLQVVRFIYCGPSVEAVLDRLPTAEILSEKDGEYEIRAEVFGGKGIEMWLRSQGEYIRTIHSSRIAPSETIEQQ